MHTVQIVPFVAPPAGSPQPLMVNRDEAADNVVRLAVRANAAPLGWFEPKPIHIEQGYTPREFRYRSKWGSLVALPHGNGTARPAGDTVGTKGFPALRIGGSGFSNATGQPTKNAQGILLLDSRRLIGTQGWAMVFSVKIGPATDGGGVATGAGGPLFVSDDVENPFRVSIDLRGRLQVNHTSANFELRDGTDLRGSSRVVCLHYDFTAKIMRLYLDGAVSPTLEVVVTREYTGAGRIVMGGSLNSTIPGNIENRAWDVALGDKIFFPGNVSLEVLNSARGYVLSKM